jgi:hypothetical protein
MAQKYNGWLLVGTRWRRICTADSSEACLSLLLLTARGLGLGGVLRVLPRGRRPDSMGRRRRVRR